VRRRGGAARNGAGAGRAVMRARRVARAASGAAALRIVVGLAAAAFGAEFQVSDAERGRIEAALPARARVTPAAPRRLLIFDLNVGYPGHPSIGHANTAFALMGARTGAFAVEISRDPAVFAPASLERFDAVFFNNTVGNCFEDASLRESLVQFVYRGGGLLGVHGATVAFTRWPGAVEDWPEFGIMLGGRGARHRAADERVVVKLDSPEHPLNVGFGGKPFEYASEFFRVGEPYSRGRVRVLFSIDTERTDLAAGGARPERADGDYALAWVRGYGRGRVCYCTIAHSPADFMDPAMLAFYLGAAQYVLGDLAAPATPSARLTPAALARERLGWRIAAGPADPGGETFFESIDRAAALGAGYVCGSGAQKVGGAVDGALAPGLSAEARRAIRLKLDAAGVRLLAYRLDPRAAVAEDLRAAFAFARAMGVETINAEQASGAPELLGELCETHDLVCAVRGQGGGPPPWEEGAGREVLGAPGGRRAGICGDLARWIGGGDAAAEALAAQGGRVKVFELRGGTRAELRAGGPGERFLRRAARAGLQPMFLVLLESGRPEEAAESLRRLDELSLKCAPE